MHEVIWQENNGIEILLSGDLTGDEFKEVLHQLESLCAANPTINVLIDTAGLRTYDLDVVREDFDFFKNYRKKLGRVAVVSDSKFHATLMKLFDIFTEATFKSFPEDHIKEARNWIFPSRFPS